MWTVQKIDEKQRNVQQRGQPNRKFFGRFPIVHINPFL